MKYHLWEGKSWSQINLFKEQMYEEQQSTLWAWWIRISGTIKVIRETSVVLLKHIPQFLPWRRTETGSVPTGFSYCTHTFNSLHTCNSCSRLAVMDGWSQRKQVHKYTKHVRRKVGYMYLNWFISTIFKQYWRSCLKWIQKRQHVHWQRQAEEKWFQTVI